MAGDHPHPGSGPQDQHSGPGGQHGGADPAAVANQATQLDGVPIPTQGGGPVPPPAPGTPPTGTPDAGVAYQPTAAAFPAQPAPGAPVGPYDPQGAPAYGYPQGAPTPPPYAAPQGGYGQPAPQGPYGAPQFGQQAAGYGYPGPAGAPAPGAAGKRNPVMVFGAVAGSVLAVAIVIGLIVLFSGSSPVHNTSAGTSGGTTTSGGTGSGGTSGGTTEAGKLNPAWSAKATASGTDARSIGQWANDKLVVRGDAADLTAYNLTDGQVAWTIKPPEGTKSFCSMSPSTNSKNIGAVSFNLGDDDCAAVGAIDATTGKLIYKTGSPLKSKSYYTHVTVSDTTLTAASGALLAGFNLTDGSQVWSYKDRGDYCNEESDTADGVVVITDFCAGSTPERQLTVLDANTGKATSTFKLNGDSESLSGIVSTKPLVLEISSGTDSDYLQGIDASGNPMAKIPMKVTGEDKLRLSAAADPIAKDVVENNVLYVQVDKNNKAGIRAIDLATGKTLWTVDGPEGGFRLSASYKGGKVYAIAVGGYDKGAKVVTLSPADGSTTDVNTFSAKNLGFMPFDDAQVLVADDGRVLAVQSSPTEAAVTLYTKK